MNNMLFFYYDFINKTQESELKSLLKIYNLKAIKIKKNAALNLLSNIKYTHLKNVFENNTFIIIADNKTSLIAKKMFQTITTINNIYLTGA